MCCSPWGRKETDMTEGLNNSIRACPYTRNYYLIACAHIQSVQSCLTLCDPMDHSPPSSSIHRVFLIRILQ